MRKLLISAPITWLILVPIVFATIINIPDDYLTIQEGVNVSSDGDTVLVQPGTYFENINFNGHNIVLASLFLTTQDTSYISLTVIDGDSSGSVVAFENEGNNSSVISGFTLQNGFSAFGGGIYCPGVNSPTIEYNIIANNSTEWGGGGIYFENTNSIVRYNVIYNNFTIAFGGGVLCSYYSYASIINNTFSKNGAFFGGGICCLEGSFPIIKNTILWGDSAFVQGDEILNDDNADPTITYCDIENYLWPDEGNISADPMFANPDYYDFHLLYGSPCIDAGDPSSPYDPDGTVCDIGAFYYDQTTGIDDDCITPIKFILSQNYPNPFNASTKISYSLSEQSEMTVEIYDILGRKVEAIDEGEQTSGEHQLVWNAKDHPSGIYFYRIKAGDYTDTKKMVLLR